MTCSGRFAEAWQFAAFWCVGAVLMGKDDSGGVENVELTDNSANFISAGVEPHTGMVLYNLTDGTFGEVIAVTQTTLTATGVTWDDCDQYRIVAISGNEISAIEMHLDIAAADVSAALAATGACDCTWQGWAADYVAKLNIIDAAVFYNCSCGAPRHDADQKQSLLDWMTGELDKLREGKIAICVGDTGQNYPAVGWAEINHTPWNEAQIVANRAARGN